MSKGSMSIRRQFLLTAMPLLLVFSLIGIIPAPVAAQSLNELRSSGVLGEGYDGLVHVHRSGGGAQTVADTVNAKRSQIYTKRAKEQGISPAQVGRVYAKELFGKASKGTWFLEKSGNWREK